MKNIQEQVKQYQSLVQKSKLNNSSTPKQAMLKTEIEIKKQIINIISENAQMLISTIQQSPSILEREKGGHKINIKNPIFKSLKAPTEIKLNIKNHPNIVYGHNGHIIPNNQLEDVLKNYFLSVQNNDIQFLCAYLKNVSQYINIEHFTNLIGEDNEFKVTECINLIAQSVIWNPANLTQAPEDGIRIFNKEGKIYPANNVDTRALKNLDNKILAQEIIKLTKILEIKPELLADTDNKVSIIQKIQNLTQDCVAKLSNCTDFLNIYGKIKKYKKAENCKDIVIKKVATILDTAFNYKEIKEMQDILNEVKPEVKPENFNFKQFFFYMSSMLNTTKGEYAPIEWVSYQVQNDNKTVELIDVKDPYELM